MKLLSIFCKKLFLLIYIYLLSFSYNALAQEYLSLKVSTSSRYESFGLNFSSNFKLTKDQSFSFGESLKLNYSQKFKMKTSFIAPVSGVPSVVSQRMEIYNFDLDYEFYLERDLRYFIIKGGIAPRVRFFSHQTSYTTSPQNVRNGKDFLFGIVPAVNLLVPIGDFLNIGVGYEVRFMLNEKESLEDLYPTKSALLFCLRYKT